MTNQLQMGQVQNPDPKASILYVINNLERGGTETHLCHILPGLAKCGYRPILFTTGFPGELSQTLTENGIELISPLSRPNGRLNRFFLFKPVRMLLVILQFAFILLFRRPDAIHFFLPHSYLIFAPVAWLMGRNNLIMSRRSLNNYQDKYRGVRCLERFLHRRMSLILGNSNQVREQLIQKESAPENRTKLIYNGIPLPSPAAEENRHNTRRNLGLREDQLIFIIVANLIPYKGHSDLLRALGNSQNQIKQEWRLLVVGRDDGIGHALAEQAKTEGISENILFLGARSDVQDLLACADLGLSVSHEEGFSNAILEAMAAGLPVIATNVGGNPEAVRNGENGVIVPAGDPEALSNALTRLCADQKLMEEIGQRNRQSVQDRFSLERCVQSYDRIYQEFIRPRD